MSPSSRRIVVVLYAGDYRSALADSLAGRPEKYYGLDYAVRYLRSIRERGDEVTVLTLVQPEAYDVDHPEGFRTVGLGPGATPRDVRRALRALDPTHLVVRTPSLPVMQFARRHRIRTITLLADSFPGISLRGRLLRRAMRFYLNGHNVDWVGNHGYPSSRALVELGVRSSKVVPWDWPPLEVAGRDERPPPSGRVDLLYVGSVSEVKGVGDLLRAVPRIASAGVDPHLTVCGDGRVEQLRPLAEAVPGAVDFLGRVSHEEVMERLRAADIAVVPSRHSYPEGYPLTILEALSMHVPLVVSDHEMFRSSLIDRETAMVFPSGDSSALADKVLELVGDPELYARLRRRSGQTHASLQVPTLWGDFIESWVYGDVAGARRLAAAALSEGP